jgi:predicted MFS family arabinose efflux permease
VAFTPDEGRLPVVASLVLMVGTGVFLAGLTRFGWWTVPLVPVGLVVGLLGLRRITPRGTLLARPGLPAAAAGAFLLSCAFLAVDGFLPLMLTKVRGLSVGEAGIVITAMSLSWAAGSWWESRVVARVGARALVTGGGLLLAGATALVATGLIESWPIWVPYVGWGLGGLAMGITFPTIPLSVMGEASEGREAGELSSAILMDFLGIGLGAGLGGASVALADAGVLSLEGGIAGAFGIGLVCALVLAAIGRRIPDARPVDSAA